MTDTPSPAETLSAEERRKRIDKETSAGKYAVKQLYDTTVLIGGVAAGAAATRFGLFKNPKVAKWAENKALAFGASSRDTGKNIATGVGAFIGSMVSTQILGYGHWKNAETEKLAVGEINADVGNLVKQRQKFAQTLTHQEQIIKELIAERQGQGSHTERQNTAEPSAISRG